MEGYLHDQPNDASKESHSLDCAVLYATLSYFEETIGEAVLDYVAEVSIHLDTSIVSSKFVSCFKHIMTTLALSLSGLGE